MKDIFILLNVIKQNLSKKEYAESIHLWIQIIGGIVTIISVILLVVQLNQTNKAIKNATRNEIYGRMVEIDRMFVENPELRPYFYSGLTVKEVNYLLNPPRIPDKIFCKKVDAATELMTDFFAQVVQGLDDLPDSTFNGWACYIEKILINSPSIREFYNSEQSWYENERAAKIFEKVTKELEKIRDNNENK